MFKLMEPYCASTSQKYLIDVDLIRSSTFVIEYSFTQWTSIREFQADQAYKRRRRDCEAFDLLFFFLLQKGTESRKQIPSEYIENIFIINSFRMRAFCFT